MTLDGKLFRGLFEHERLKPATIRTSQENMCNLPQLKQIVKYRYEGVIIINLQGQIYLLMYKISINFFLLNF